MAKNSCYLGYRYSHKRKNQNGSDYCVCVKCTTTATSYSDLSVIVRDQHTHLPDDTNKVVLEMRKNLKRKVIEESGPINRIVDETYHIINTKSNDLIINLPSVNTLKNTSQKQVRLVHQFLQQSINFHFHYRMFIAEQHRVIGFCYLMDYLVVIVH